VKEKIVKCDYCNGTGKIKKHQYQKASEDSFECTCGEPMVSIKHFDNIGDWNDQETWLDKSSKYFN